MPQSEITVLPPQPAPPSYEIADEWREYDNPTDPVMFELGAY